MELISVNLGKQQYLQTAGGGEMTGIYKLPTPEAVELTTGGLAGDAVCNTQHHGGPDQAVYIYGGVDYAWWAGELGRVLPPGTFGENLTIDGLESARFGIGDRLLINRVLLEVTAPRIPCGKLAARMGEAHFVKRFRAAERPGLYCRVLQPGWVQAGLGVTWQAYPGQTVSILEMFRDYYRKDLDEPAIRRYLAAPIALRSRAEYEQALARLASRDF